MGDGEGLSVRRVVQPQDRYLPSSNEQDEAWSRLLSKMESVYADASDRLVLRARPVLLACFLDAGICIGLLDPVSNIIVNTICTSDARPDHREKVLVGAIVEEKLHEMGKRSLEGLVAFLVYFFPYLDKWEAVRYLLLANADLLAAARLIVADRGMAQFSPLTSSVAAPAFEEALTLAAQIAKHSQPKELTHVWRLLSSRLFQVLNLLLEVQAHSSHQTLDNLKIILEEPVVPYLAISWDFAAARLLHSNKRISNMPYQHTRSLQMVLLDTIHGFYLKALALLPTNELRSSLHRSLLRAGYCYGPMDPVSNIIVNTIWYEANFPAARTPTLDVIGPESLTRLESRSFYGLVSFLQTRYHHMSEHQIVQCLVAACGQLNIADPKYMSAAEVLQVEQHHQHLHFCNERRKDLSMSYIFDTAIMNMEQQIPCSTIEEAYAAAAIAAWHPNPEEQAKFLASWKEMCFRFSPFDLQAWLRFLSPEQKPTPERIYRPYYPARAGKQRSLNQQKRISKMVRAALDCHLPQHNGKPLFDLHIICCVNDKIKPEYSYDICDSLSFAPCKYRYSHVNFLATKRGCIFGDASSPVLFFAEFDNENKDGAPLFCCQVPEPAPFIEHVRCIYCESIGARIVHPPSVNFHGGGSEVEKMIRGEHIDSIDRYFCKSEYAVERLYAVEEDFLYADVN